MKKKFYTLFLLSFFFTAFHIQANVITVKGTVKLSNGNPAKNTEVKIAVYLSSSTAACSEQTVLTNSDGFYSKELTCTGDIQRSRISVINCDGKSLVLEKEVPAGKIVEASFSLCIASPATCAARFTAESLPASSSVAALSVKFNSAGSEISTGDNIIQRTWDFHDGNALLTDRVDPTHVFPREGTYEVCLTIKTAKGCESRICKQIVVPPASPIACTAKFTFEKLGLKKFRFNSSVSITVASDNVIERKWDFGDGTSSNDISPAHEFPRVGNYQVCLFIKTAKGCESRVCVAVKVEENPSSNEASIIIESIYPIPAHENLTAVIYSKNNNIEAKVTVVDMYGKVQLSQQVILYQGSNSVKTRVYTLPAGSYFYKVTTRFGTVSKSFYKL